MNTHQEATPRQLWEKIRDKRRNSWRSGQRVRVESIIAQLPQLAADPEVVAELAYQEFCLLEEDGEQVQPSEFLDRFPQAEKPLKQRLAKHSAAAGRDSGYRETVDASTFGSTFAGLRLGDDDADGVEALAGKQFGRYMIVDQLGEGAMGIVYLARDSVLNRPVALKFPRFTAADVEQGQRERFFREAQAAAAIDHPNVCPIYDMGQADDQDFIAMAYVAGPTIADMLRDLGTLAPLEALKIVHQVALAMDECHLQGVVHRDLKPSNIVVNQRGTPIVMDFGLASLEAATRVTGDEQVLGTLQYMSPEQLVADSEHVGPRSDVYSLGTMLYEMLTGRPPFTGKYFMQVYKQIQDGQLQPPSAIRPEIDSRIDSIVLQAMTREPDERFPSMVHFADAVASFMHAADAAD